MSRGSVLLNQFFLPRQTESLKVCVQKQELISLVIERECQQSASVRISAKQDSLTVQFQHLRKGAPLGSFELDSFLEPGALRSLADLF